MVTKCRVQHTQSTSAISTCVVALISCGTDTAGMCTPTALIMLIEETVSAAVWRFFVTLGRLGDGTKI